MGSGIYNRLAGLAGTGQTAAGNLASLGSQYMSAGNNAGQMANLGRQRMQAAHRRNRTRLLTFSAWSALVRSADFSAVNPSATAVYGLKESCNGRNHATRRGCLAAIGERISPAGIMQPGGAISGSSNRQEHCSSVWQNSRPAERPGV